MVATTPWTMQPARAAGRLMAAALRGSPVAFGTAFGTGFGAGFATATGVMFLDDDVQGLEILEIEAVEVAQHRHVERRVVGQMLLDIGLHPFGLGDARGFAAGDRGLVVAPERLAAAALQGASNGPAAAGGQWTIGDAPSKSRKTSSSSMPVAGRL